MTGVRSCRIARRYAVFRAVSAVLSVLYQVQLKVDGPPSCLEESVSRHTVEPFD